jgi:microcystin-dependent protein|tara:strand:+ start:5542 stop:6117 length:576 start_codon:yes stop_codon:yes gene_type:complete
MSNYEATRYNFDGASLSGVEGVNTGIIIPWSASSLPSGFLECDGSNVSRSTYSALFAVVGTLYGAGDGSSTFGLPDLQNRVCLGKSNNRALASTGGAETVSQSGNVSITAELANHSISIAELAAHNHSGGIRNSGLQDAEEGNDRTTAAPTGTAGSGSAHNHNLTVNASSFTGAANSVLQPFLTSIYIIKT